MVEYNVLAQKFLSIPCSHIDITKHTEKEQIIFCLELGIFAQREDTDTIHSYIKRVIAKCPKTLLEWNNEQ